MKSNELMQEELEALARVMEDDGGSRVIGAMIRDWALKMNMMEITIQELRDEDLVKSNAIADFQDESDLPWEPPVLELGTADEQWDLFDVLKEDEDTLEWLDNMLIIEEDIQKENDEAMERNHSGYPPHGS